MASNHRHRYTIQYPWTGPGYIVWDTETETTVFRAPSKPEAIAESQRLNGFTPVDGNEQTYGGQIKCAPTPKGSA